MATGTFLFDISLLPHPNADPAIESRPLWIGEPSLTEFKETYPFGPIADVLPVEPARARTGVIMTSFFEDFYNRIHFMPKIIDFGAISGEVSATFYVWNAFLVPTTVNSITLVNAEGLTLDGPATPTLYGPLAVKSYTLTTTDQGPATINAELLFDTDTQGLLAVRTVSATGVRSYMSPFQPNWKSPVEITHEFKTEIIAQRSGKEQRRALRQAARKRIEFTSSMHGDTLRAALRLLNKAHNRTILMPEYPKKARVVSAIAPGSPDVEVDEVPYWIVADAPVILAFGNRMESRKVASVAGTTVTMQSSSPEGWPAGTKLYASVSGKFSQQLAAQRPTNNVAVFRVTFDVAPGSETPPAEPYTITEFNGREVFFVKPNWGETPQLTMQQRRDDLDYGIGRIVTYSPISFAERLWRATFVGRNFDALDAIRAFFNRAKGRRGEFYMPTWDADLRPKIPAAVDSNSIRVEGTEVYAAYGEDTVYRAVCVRMKSGLVIYNRVTAVSQVTDGEGTDSIVTVATPWPVEITADNIIMISWMPVWRMASDAATFEWLTSEVGQVQLTFQTLEDLV